MLGELAVLVTAICWGISPSLYALGVETTNPFVANTVRLLITSVFSIILGLLLTEVFFWDPIEIGFLVLASLVGIGFGDWLYLKSLEAADVSFVVPLVYSYPLLVALIKSILYHDPPSSFTIVGAMVILCGVTIVVRERRDKNRAASETTDNSNCISRVTARRLARKVSIIQVILPIVTSMSYTTTIILYARSLEYFPPIMANAIRIPIVSLLFTILLFSNPHGRNEFKRIRGRTAVILGISGILALGIAGVLFLLAIDLIGSARTAAISSTSPIFAAIFAVAFRGEKLTLLQTTGILVTCVGILLVSLG